MERIVHNVISIEKPKHIQVSVLKGSMGVNGRNGRDGANGMKGENGKDGGVFIPNVQDGIIHWEFAEEVNEYPSPTNMLASIGTISNTEIFNIVNGE